MFLQFREFVLDWLEPLPDGFRGIAEDFFGGHRLHLLDPFVQYHRNSRNNAVRGRTVSARRIHPVSIIIIQLLLA
jgi:hypothetical protein